MKFAHHYQTSSARNCAHRPVRPTSITMFRQLGLYIKPDFLPREECRHILAEMAMSVNTSAGVMRRGRSMINEHIRKTRMAFVSEETSQQIMDRLLTMRKRLQRHFGVHTHRCCEPQFLMYKRGAFFRPHPDNDRDRRQPKAVLGRQLSAVIFLNGNDTGRVRLGSRSFGGGLLVFHRLPEHPTAETYRLGLVPSCGLLVVFPSGIWHEVTPVTWGTRCSIVSWFY